VKRRILFWLYFRVERALGVRFIEKNLQAQGMSRRDAQYIISSYRKAVKNNITL